MNLSDPKVREAGARAIRDTVLALDPHETPDSRIPWPSLSPHRQFFWAHRVGPHRGRGRAAAQPTRACIGPDQHTKRVPTRGEHVSNSYADEALKIIEKAVEVAEESGPWDLTVTQQIAVAQINATLAVATEMAAINRHLSNLRPGWYAIKNPRPQIDPEDLKAALVALEWRA